MKLMHVRQFADEEENDFKVLAFYRYLSKKIEYMG